MQALAGLKKLIKGKRLVEEKPPSEAYDLWSTGYDNQPGNLMLHLDRIIFSELFGAIDIHGRSVADIGCGTGRHWAEIFEKHPSRLTGFDISDGMLSILKQKFPQSEIVHIIDDLFTNIPDASFDLIISTLTVAHIKNIEPALNAWCRILKRDGEIIITDFHPELLANGGKRSFSYEQKQMYRY